MSKEQYKQLAYTEEIEYACLVCCKEKDNGVINLDVEYVFDLPEDEEIQKSLYNKLKAKFEDD